MVLSGTAAFVILPVSVHRTEMLATTIENLDLAVQ